MMQLRDDVVATTRARLIDALDCGYDDIAAGRVLQLETEDQIDALFAALCSASTSPTSRGPTSMRRPPLGSAHGRE